MPRRSELSAKNISFLSNNRSYTHNEAAMSNKTIAKVGGTKK